MEFSKAIAVAAQCWCQPSTEKITMDHRLAEAFARALVEHTTKAEVHVAQVMSRENNARLVTATTELVNGIRQTIRETIIQATGAPPPAPKAEADQVMAHKGQPIPFRVTWYQMETAPKNGRPVQLAWPGRWMVAIPARWTPDGWHIMLTGPEAERFSRPSKPGEEPRGPIAWAECLGIPDGDATSIY